AVQVKPEAMIKRSKGGITTCPICGDAYPGSFGAICRSCQGESPYASRDAGLKASTAKLPEGLKVVPVDEAEGKTAVHDMPALFPEKARGRNSERITILLPTISVDYR
ncbi:hypothetical protein ADUPG1_004060, partial [Aduncisulcus paluster]